MVSLDFDLICIFIFMKDLICIFCLKLWSVGGFSWFCFWSFGGVEIEVGLDSAFICIFCFFFFMKDLTCIYGLRLLSVVLSRIFVLFTLFCIVVMVFVLHGLKIQAIFFYYWATDWTWGGEAHRARGARRGGFGFRKKKNPFNKRGGFGFQS